MKPIRSRLPIVLAFFFVTYLFARAAGTPGIAIKGPTGTTSLNNPGELNVTGQIVPLNGFTGQINVACNLIQSPSGAINLPLCQENWMTSPPLISGSKPVSFDLFLATARVGIPGAMSSRHIPWLPIGGSAVFACCFFLLPKRRKGWTVLLIPLIALVSVGVLGCGASNKNQTTPGTYMFRIAATAVSNSQITSSTTFNVLVE